MHLCTNLTRLLTIYPNKEGLQYLVCPPIVGVGQSQGRSQDKKKGGANFSIKLIDPLPAIPYRVLLETTRKKHYYSSGSILFKFVNKKYLGQLSNFYECFWKLHYGTTRMLVIPKKGVGGGGGGKCPFCSPLATPLSLSCRKPTCFAI